ncbi:MAG: hypothetical protein ACFCUE_09735 [Candidatus Bathyarchaeia archaeon]
MKKTLATILSTVCLILVLQGLFFSLPKVGAQSNVISNINVSTTWYKANSPYILTTPLVVDPKATLTIEAGVQVNLNGNYLQADGALIVQGTANETIHLSGGSIILNSNSKIKNVILSNDLQVIINSGSPEISDSQVDSRIVVKGGSPKISNTIISDGIHADAIGGPITIENNRIKSKSGYSVIYIQGIHANILGNTIEGNNNCNTGIEVYLLISSASITNNTILHSAVGIHILTGPTNRNDIIENAVFNNTVGICARGSTVVQNNTIAYNEIGLQTEKANIVSGNNFLSNSRYSLEAVGIHDIAVTNNWWGTVDNATIDQMIYDRNDEGVRGQVSYLPVLNKSNPKTPAIPAENMTPPVSTQPTIPNETRQSWDWAKTTLSIIGVVVLFVVTFALLFFRRNRKAATFTATPMAS